MIKDGRIDRSHLDPYQRSGRGLLVPEAAAGLRNHIKVIVGGAVLNQSFADEIGAQGYGKDAMDAVRVVDLLMNGNS